MQDHQCSKSLILCVQDTRPSSTSRSPSKFNHGGYCGAKKHDLRSCHDPVVRTSSVQETKFLSCLAAKLSSVMLKVKVTAHIFTMVEKGHHHIIVDLKYLVQ